jgi:hypothetical protein
MRVGLCRLKKRWRTNSAMASERFSREKLASVLNGSSRALAGTASFNSTEWPVLRICVRKSKIFQDF